MYTVNVCIVNNICDGVTIVHDGEIVDTRDAVKIEPHIDRSNCIKKDVYEAVKLACQKLLEYFH